uniref:L27-1 domain-containing protein n=1 Tax=Cyclopterus lumpus TaxID=8103 RepID=A0A8C3AKG0_CYCLU
MNTNICRLFAAVVLSDVFILADTERAVELLRCYQANLTSPEEQALKNSVGKVSSILGSQLFHALLGKKNTVKQLVFQKGVFRNSDLLA